MIQMYYLNFYLAACLAWGPFAVFACPAAYAIAAGITEGKTVKEIERAFDSAIRQIDTKRKKIDAIGVKTKSLVNKVNACLLYTSPSPRDGLLSRMPSSA